MYLVKGLNTAILLVVTFTLGFIISPSSNAKEIFKDWSVECSKYEFGGCQMVQSLKHKSLNKTFATFTLSDNNPNILNVTVPLGVYIPRGIGIKTKNGSIEQTSYLVCLPDGCNAQFELALDYIKIFKKDNEVEIRFYQADSKPISVSMSLDGFSSAYSLLTNKK